MLVSAKHQYESTIGISMWFLEHNDSDSAGLVWGQIIWICNKFPGNVDDAGPVHNWRIIATEKLVPLSMMLSPEANYPQSSRLTINCICFGSHKSIHWSDRYQCLYSEGFPCSSVGKESGKDQCGWVTGGKFARDLSAEHFSCGWHGVDSCHMIQVLLLIPLFFKTKS